MISTPNTLYLLHKWQGGEIADGTTFVGAAESDIRLLTLKIGALRRSHRLIKVKTGKRTFG